jgi:hypothetical protein
MEEKEKLDLVATAISELQPVFGPYCALRKTPENGLVALPDNEIERLLKRLRDEPKVIIFRTDFDEKWDRLGRGIRVPATPETEKRRTEAFKPGDFKVIKQPGFETWHASLKMKLAATPESLSPTNFDKVWITVQEIAERLEMAMSPRLSLPLRFSKYTALIHESDHHVSGPYRLEAIRFLTNVGAVVGSQQESASSLVIGLNLLRFQKFKEEIEAIRKTRTDLGPLPSSNEPQKLEPGTERLPDGAIYTLEYNPNVREIVVNGFLISKMDLAGKNEQIFGFLFDNPNRVVKIEEITPKLGAADKDRLDLPKFVESIGFTGDLKRVFFDVRAESIVFRNPVNRDLLESLGLRRIRVQPYKPMKPGSPRPGRTR